MDAGGSMESCIVSVMTWTSQRCPLGTSSDREVVQLSNI